MKARARRIVRDSDLGAELDQRLDRCCLCRTVKVVVRTRSGLPSRTCRRSASFSGLMPVNRIKAMTTSIRSADAISAWIWCPTRGSPGALVRSVVSSSGISGLGISSSCPFGSLRRMARSTLAGCASCRPASRFSPTSERLARLVAYPIPHRPRRALPLEDFRWRFRQPVLRATRCDLQPQHPEFHRRLASPALAGFAAVHRLAPSPGARRVRGAYCHPSRKLRSIISSSFGTKEFDEPLVTRS